MIQDNIDRPDFVCAQKKKCPTSRVGAVVRGCIFPAFLKIQQRKFKNRSSVIFFLILRTCHQPFFENVLRIKNVPPTVFPDVSQIKTVPPTVLRIPAPYERGTPVLAS